MRHGGKDISIMEKHSSIKAAICHKERYRLVFLGMIIGIFAALSVSLYRFILSEAESLRTMLISKVSTGASLGILFICLIVLGIIVGLVTRSEPLISGSGIPQVEGQLLGYFTPKWLPVLVKKFIGGALCLLGGLSLGREGPSIQIGAMAAQGVCEKLNLSRVEQKYLITCGACAGLAAAFNAPLAGLMFGLEEIQKNFSSRAVFSAMVAAIIADIISKMFFGTNATLDLSIYAELPPPTYYMLYLLLGIVMGGFGVLYNQVLIWTQDIYAKLRVLSWGRMIIPFLFAGGIALFLPEILGGGHEIILGLANGEYVLSFMLVLLLSKFIFSMICFCAGAPGGIFFPLLVLGSLMGCIFASLSTIVFGLPPEYQLAFMLLGMVGMFSSVVRAPLTGIILVVEMSGSLTQLLGLTIVACTAWLVADLLHSRPVYEYLLDRITPDSLERQKHSGEQNIIELTVPYKSHMDGKQIRAVNWPENCLVVCITRGTEQIVPRGDTVIGAGDMLSVVCPVGDEAIVRKALDAATAGLEVSS